MDKKPLDERLRIRLERIQTFWRASKRTFNMEKVFDGCLFFIVIGSIIVYVLFKGCAELLSSLTSSA